jgi:hypothetical protein
LTGARLLPFVDYFALFATSFAAAMELKVVTFNLLGDLGLNIHPTKGYHTATQEGEHLGMTIDTKTSEFLAPKTKIDNIAAAGKQLLARTTQKKRWVPVEALASIAGKSQLLYLAIPVFRFYLRELHDVVKATESWTRPIRMTKKLKRDLEWWKLVPENTTELRSLRQWRPRTSTATQAATVGELSSTTT